MAVAGMGWCSRTIRSTRFRHLNDPRSNGRTGAQNCLNASTIASLISPSVSYVSRPRRHLKILFEHSIEVASSVVFIECLHRQALAGGAQSYAVPLWRLPQMRPRHPRAQCHPAASGGRGIWESVSRVVGEGGHVSGTFLCRPVPPCTGAAS